MSTIYRSIITSKFRTQNLMHFYNLIGDTESPAPKTNQAYLSFGKPTPWALNENDVGFAPPYPMDSSDGVVDVWSNMMGIVKIRKEYFDAVVPRRDWGDIRYDRPLSFYIGDIVVVNSAPYNVTTPGQGMMVYRCVDIPERGDCSISSVDNKVQCLRLGGIWEPENDSFNPPKGHGDAIDMQDGYLWEYLYTIPADVSINRVSNEYIVVPLPDEVDRDPARWGLENVIQSDMNNDELVFRVRCNTLRFRAYLDSIHFPAQSLPGNSGFRQMSIILNPLEKRKLSDSPDVAAKQNNYKPDQLDKHSGEMIYIENRQPIIRAMDQVEEVSINFEF